MYSDRVNTIDIYNEIHETYIAVTSKKDTYIGPVKQAAENHLLALSARGRKEIWNMAFERFDSYDHTVCG